MTGPPGTCSPKIALDPRLRASLRSSRRQCSSKAVLQLGLAKSPLNRAARRLSPQVRAWSTLSLLPSISWTSRIGLRQHARRKEGNQRPLRCIVARLLLLSLDVKELLREFAVLDKARDDVAEQPLIPTLLHQLWLFSAAMAPLSC